MNKEICETCGGALTWSHDHKTDNTGVDDGPPLYRERKKPPPKSASEMAAIRAKAWETRRRVLGPHGHR